VDIVDNAREREENKRCFEEKYLKVNALRIYSTDSKKDKLDIVSFLLQLWMNLIVSMHIKQDATLKKLLISI
jgi:hypothetical protein